jgi:hypothetical protein
LSGLIVEGCTQIFREGQEPTIKFGKHCSPKLLNVRFSKARHLEDSLSCSAKIVNQEAASCPIAQGCIKLRFRGRGQLVPGTAGLIIRGQAVPAPSSRVFELELDAALPIASGE